MACTVPDQPAPVGQCAKHAHSAPALLVLIQIFARNRMLLLKRGLEPYRGKWAPPGGFVEGGESLEAAACREIREEVGIELERTQLLPHAVVSVPKINQVYHIFIARLDEIVPALAVPPESLEVGWFSATDLANLEIWDPGTDVDTMRGYAADPGKE
jgi:8-oxo-dGTP diphosphatase